MQGFDPEFIDFPDYIYTITYRIWEGRDLQAIKRFYRDDCPVRAPGGLLVGTQPVIDATINTLAEIPDRRLLGEDVVWKGDDQLGYLSSHRILSIGTYAGTGTDGKATDYPLRYRIIADCWVKQNQVVEEWLVRDQGAIAKCLGMTPRQLADSQIKAGNTSVFRMADDPSSAYKPAFADTMQATNYAKLWRSIWAQSEVAREEVNQAYHYSATLEGPSGTPHSGPEQISDFFLFFLTSQSNRRFAIQDLTCITNDRGTTVSMRWTTTGKTTGYGAFGDFPAGFEFEVMGISQARFAGKKIIAEWVVIDEVACWKQILLEQTKALATGQ